ncbi:ABC transporter ATP-binding protein [Sporolactobacillus shoreicorticis]|uniref:ABC transporter ATP-binding protein n=1 Tax=Sporolactobacillus shoreicorticis TaxID=1923877 RepID=A0ABW5S892_9BACL|nr:ABC transporter ATP-binding protein [Sporolactobacillus shoreicorticis]MCO7125538.1 ABC transporter ATP-binding protein [Sporolactobacillus shoreicorticis]
MKLTLNQLTLRFSDVTAVDHLSCTVNDGEFVSLLGPSGCGKSSTLFMLAGLYQPTEGELFFDDTKVNTVEPEHREIGMVFQNYALYPHMSVRKNIMFPLKMKKVSRKEANARAVEIAELVKIESLLERKPAQLSGGQQQRVAIARALVKHPKLLLLDEPLSNLDARLRINMRAEIKRIQRQVGITTIFVTHDQEEALSISDRILLMNQGRFQQFDHPQDVYLHPTNRFVAEFLGNPPINLLPVNFSEGTARLVQSDKQANSYLGVRPEHLAVVNDGANALRGRSESIESVGRDHVLTVAIQNQKVRILIDADQPIKAGDMVYVRPKPDRAYLFDNEGNTITAQWNGGLTDD